ncbi:MAG: hypothetical protein JWO65_2612 [Sphingomonas bacterium]|jgi:hypothetical protein|nr:hypothetical protein [Sphingomonas bacterium]
MDEANQPQTPVTPSKADDIVRRTQERDRAQRERTRDKVRLSYKSRQISLQFNAVDISNRFEQRAVPYLRTSLPLRRALLLAANFRV